jgi:hypothetical protein
MLVKQKREYVSPAEGEKYIPLVVGRYATGHIREGSRQ